jgi:hypothetical protein
MVGVVLVLASRGPKNELELATAALLMFAGATYVCWIGKRGICRRLDTGHSDPPSNAPVADPPAADEPMAGDDE